jgi:hypothetical protein
MVKKLFFNVVVSNIRHFSSIISTTKMRVRNLRTNDHKSFFCSVVSRILAEKSGRRLGVA